MRHGSPACGGPSTPVSVTVGVRSLTPPESRLGGAALSCWATSLVASSVRPESYTANASGRGAASCGCAITASHLPSLHAKPAGHSPGPEHRCPSQEESVNSAAKAAPKQRGFSCNRVRSDRRRLAALLAYQRLHQGSLACSNRHHTSWVARHRPPLDPDHS